MIVISSPLSLLKNIWTGKHHRTKQGLLRVHCVDVAVNTPHLPRLQQSQWCGCCDRSLPDIATWRSPLCTARVRVLGSSLVLARVLPQTPHPATHSHTRTYPQKDAQKWILIIIFHENERSTWSVVFIMKFIIKKRKNKLMQMLKRQPSGKWNIIKGSHLNHSLKWWN